MLYSATPLRVLRPAKAPLGALSAISRRSGLQDRARAQATRVELPCRLRGDVSASAIVHVHTISKLFASSIRDSFEIAAILRMARMPSSRYASNALCSLRSPRAQSLRALTANAPIRMSLGRISTNHGVKHVDDANQLQFADLKMDLDDLRSALADIHDRLSEIERRHGILDTCVSNNCRAILYLESCYDWLKESR